jgi:integral membrane sensor domain MASE1
MAIFRLLPAFFGVAFFALCFVSDLLVFKQSSITSFWPASGLFIFTVAFAERNQIWKFVLAALIANNLFNIEIKDVPVVPSLLFSFSNVAEAFVGRALVYPARKRLTPFRSLSRYMLFVVSWVVAATLIGSLIGATAVSWAFPDSQFLKVWAIWWLADSLGALTIAPILLLYFDLERIRNMLSTLQSRIEFSSIFILNTSLIVIFFPTFDFD